jgi:hypothetical protein
MATSVLAGSASSLVTGSGVGAMWDESGRWSVRDRW